MPGGILSHDPHALDGDQCGEERGPDREHSTAKKHSLGALESINISCSSLELIANYITAAYPFSILQCNCFVEHTKRLLSVNDGARLTTARQFGFAWCSEHDA